MLLETDGTLQRFSQAAFSGIQQIINKSDSFVIVFFCLYSVVINEYNCSALLQQWED